MVYVVLKNGDSGQVVKGIKLKGPDNRVWEVTGSSRKGINRYEMRLVAKDGSRRTVMNHEIKGKWELVGRFHTPEELAALFNRKLDPDANKPRHLRESFWKMRSKPGTHNYRQKKRLMDMESPDHIKFLPFWKKNLDWLVTYDQ